MKKIGMHALVLVCMIGLMLGIGAAQTVGLKIDVPFSFNVAEKVLPAGHYLIQAPQGGTLKITGPKGAAIMVIANQLGGKPPDGPGGVAFNCYGKRCFLSRFWTARTETGLELLKGRMEKEVAGAEKRLAVIQLRGVQVAD